MGFFGTIGRIAGGFITGGPIGAIGALVPTGTPGIPGRTDGICPPGTPGCGPQRLVGAQGCPRGTVWDPATQTCVATISPFGGRALADQFGEAVMGQYGAALVPAQREGMTLVCPPKAVLGADNLCYNRRDISNKERKWPRGRRPLLTGGEMRAISIASAAAAKLETKQKQLRKMGMMKQAPRPRKARGSALLPPGHHSHVAHN